MFDREEVQNEKLFICFYCFTYTVFKLHYWTVNITVRNSRIIYGIILFFKLHYWTVKIMVRYRLRSPVNFTVHPWQPSCHGKTVKFTGFFYSVYMPICIGLLSRQPIIIM